MNNYCIVLSKENQKKCDEYLVKAAYKTICFGCIEDIFPEYTKSRIWVAVYGNEVWSLVDCDYPEVVFCTKGCMELYCVNRDYTLLDETNEKDLELLPVPFKPGYLADEP